MGWCKWLATTFVEASEALSGGVAHAASPYPLFFIEIEGVWGPLLFLPPPRHPPPHTTIRHTMCHLLCGGLGGIWGALFIFIFGALRSKDAIKISAPRAARQGPPFFLFFQKTGAVRAGASESLRPGPCPFPPPHP